MQGGAAHPFYESPAGRTAIPNSSFLISNSSPSRVRARRAVWPQTQVPACGPKGDGRQAVNFVKAGRRINFFELPAHYNLPHFWLKCKRIAQKIRQKFSETIEHFFNNPLVIPVSVCYNGLCNHQTLRVRNCAAPGRNRTQTMEVRHEQEVPLPVQGRS